MDFLKTLLAYVALTVAFSVQEGPLPQDVPTPTPLPPNVTASPIPNAPAATDVPTATPTASPIPEPTITPNMGYRTVQWQDRGSGVLKVQKKLIELGYLAEGEDDGAYGSKTTAAVRRFQKANGLSVDGIAGQATQTRLFEDPNVVPYSPPTVPPTATPTPAPETPTPSAAPTASPADDLPLPGASGDFPVDTVTTEAPVYTPEGLTLLPNGSIILGNGGATLTMTVTQDGVGYTRRPSLWVNTVGSPVMSLRELAACIDDWQLDVSESGVWVLSAAGYTVVIRETDSGLSVMVDGSAIAMESGAVRLDNGEVYISDMFLRTALRATTIYDSDEQSLILFVRNKSVSTSADGREFGIRWFVRDSAKSKKNRPVHLCLADNRAVF